MENHRDNEREALGLLFANRLTNCGHPFQGPLQSANWYTPPFWVAVNQLKFSIYKMSM